MLNNAGKHIAGYSKKVFTRIQRAIVETGIEALGREGWAKVARDDKDSLLEFLFNQGVEGESKELCLLAVVRALSKIYSGGSWVQYSMWRERWDESIDLTVLAAQDSALPLADRGWITTFIGYIYENHRDWAQALTNYDLAHEWMINTGQEHELGVTYHQIGRVYEEQRDWSQALANYDLALEWYTKTGQEHKLGGYLSPDR